MKSRIRNINNLVFNGILLLLFLKFTFSYLSVELDWWTRHLTPNIEKLNPLNLPINIMEYIEYLLIPSMLLFIFLNFKKLGILLVPFSLTFLLYGLNFGTSIYNSVSLIDSLKYSFRISAPLYFFIVLVLRAKEEGRNNRTVLIQFIVYCSFLAIVALLFFDITMNKGVVRLPVYFSSLHSHNYVLVSIFMGIAYLIKDKTWLLIAFLLASFMFLILGYNVRTAVVFYFIFIIAMLYYASDFFKYLYYKIIIFIPFFLGLLWVYLRNIDLNTFSSGRITMYVKKFDILKTYTTKDYLLGRGWESDLVRTTEWWWVEKGSHNDYLTYVVENGIPYTILFVLLILSLLFLSRKVSLIFASMVIGYLLTSALSNGMAVRPLASYFFFIVLAYIYCNNKKFIQKNNDLVKEET